MTGWLSLPLGWKQRFGDEAWQAWAIYVPPIPPRICSNCPSWWAFQEDYGPPFDGPP